MTSGVRCEGSGAHRPAEEGLEEQGVGEAVTCAAGQDKSRRSTVRHQRPHGAATLIAKRQAVRKRTVQGSHLEKHAVPHLMEIGPPCQQVLTLLHNYRCII